MILWYRHCTAFPLSFECIFDELSFLSLLWLFLRAVSHTINRFHLFAPNRFRLNRTNSVYLHSQKLKRRDNAINDLFIIYYLLGQTALFVAYGKTSDDYLYTRVALMHFKQTRFILLNEPELNTVYLLFFQWFINEHRTHTQFNWFITRDYGHFAILTWLNWAAAAAAWKFFATKSNDDTGKYGAFTGGVL